MLAPHCFDVAHVALRADPVEKRRFSRLVTQPCRLKCLLRLWHELVAEKFDMMMERLDLCQLITQESQRFLLFTFKSLLGSCKIRARLAYSGGIFAGIYPWDGERHAGVEFTHRLRGVVVALAFYHQRRIGNPRALRELKL